MMEGAGTYSENLPPASRLTNGFQPTKQGSPPLFLSLLLHLLHPSISEEGRSFLSISITLLPRLPEPCGEAENTSTLQQRRIHPELCVRASTGARVFVLSSFRQVQNVLPRTKPLSRTAPTVARFLFPSTQKQVLIFHIYLKMVTLRLPVSPPLG